MKPLNEIGLACGTDKSTMTHCYLETYEKYLGGWRDKEFTLLEIGIAAGNSLKMWHEAFPKAKIIGLDINPDCAGYCPPPIEVFIGSQTDTAFLDSVLAKIGTPDVIIDDGSHVGSDMISTFRHLFPKMKAGGLYVVEDTHAGAYIPTYAGDMEANGRSRAFNFFTGLVYDIDVAGRGSCGNASFCIDHPSETPAVPEFSRILECAHFHCSLWWFKKK